MNIKQAKARAEELNIKITPDKRINGKIYFCVIDATNFEAVIVDRAGAGSRWRPEGAICNHPRGVAIEVAITALLSRRNKTEGAS